MSKHIKDIERCYDLLKEAKSIFCNLNGDSVVSRSKISRFCIQVDRVLEESN